MKYENWNMARDLLKCMYYIAFNQSATTISAGCSDWLFQ